MSLRPFIRFHRRGSNVELVVDTLHVGIDATQFTLPITCAHEVAAELLSDHLFETKERLIRELVDQAYRDGYRDGRAKRAKRLYHDTFLGRRTP